MTGRHELTPDAVSAAQPVESIIDDAALASPEPERRGAHAADVEPDTAVEPDSAAEPDTGAPATSP